MPVFAYSSLARGLFSGRITPSNLQDAEKMLDRAGRTAYLHEVNLMRLERATVLAQQQGITVPQVALAYILRSPMNVYPLVGAANGDEFAQNMRAFDVPLTEADRAWLNLEGKDLA